MPKFNAKAVADLIRANVSDVDAERIDWAEFGRRNRAAWVLADREELCTPGSACARRVRAVQLELDKA